MDDYLSKEVIAIAKEQLQQREKCSNVPLFQESVGGCEGKQINDGHLQELFLQIKRLEKHSQVNLSMQTDSRIPGGKIIKKIIKKVLSGTMLPLFQQQNSYNLESVSCMQNMLKEICLLREENDYFRQALNENQVNNNSLSKKK